MEGLSNAPCVVFPRHPRLWINYGRQWAWSRVQGCGIGRRDSRRSLRRRRRGLRCWFELFLVFYSFFNHEWTLINAEYWMLNAENWQLTVDDDMGWMVIVSTWSGVVGWRNFRFRIPMKRIGWPKWSPANSSAICTRHAPGTIGCPGKCPAKIGCEGLKRIENSLFVICDCWLVIIYKLFSNDIFKFNDGDVSVFLNQFHLLCNMCFFVHGDIDWAEEFFTFFFCFRINRSVSCNGCHDHAQ